MTEEKYSPISDEKEAHIQKMIASDPDSPEVSDEQAVGAKRFIDAFPALAENMKKNVGGRPLSACKKVPVSIRLDQDIIAKLKMTGPGWQSRINDALRKLALP